MLKKLGLVCLIVGGVIATYVIITAGYGTILQLVGVASSDPLAGNYTSYKAVVDSAPFWLYALPALIGVISIVLVLRSPERN